MSATPAKRSIRCKPGGRVNGRLAVPGDKSISHRCLMLGGIADGDSHVSGFLDGADCTATRRAMEAMGVRVEDTGDHQLRIRGVGLHGLRAPGHALDLGNSGTSMRLLSGLLAGQAFDTELVGDESLMGRPMDRVALPLTQMNARIQTRDGKPPVCIRGKQKLQGIRYTLPVASAQVKSAVLLAGLYASGETAVIEPAPTRDHTERLLSAMGCAVVSEGAGDAAGGYGTVALSAPARLKPVELEVPGDFSSAAFFIVAAAICPGSRLTISNVGVNPTRTGLLEILTAMGARIRLAKRRDAGGEPVADIQVEGGVLRGIDVPARLVPLAIDEFPVLFVAAACAEGETRVTGAGELRHKESDRLAVMAEGLKVLGADVTLLDDGMTLRGGPLSGGTVDSGGDHRVAMAFAVASLQATGPVTVRDTANVATSYPGFVSDARSVGLKIEEHGARPVAAAPAPVIAIDGPSGSGKGTISRQVAARLGYGLLDSGALYRLVAAAAARQQPPVTDPEGLARLAARLDVRFESDEQGQERVLLDGEDVTGEIRTESCGDAASRVAAVPAVREALVGLQRGFRRRPGLVADGRDMGTVIFPDARTKIFLTASAGERADRRYKQLKQKGIDVNLAALSSDIRERDRRDAERETAPLKAAGDAVHVDTTGMTVDEVVARVLEIVAAKT